MDDAAGQIEHDAWAPLRRPIFRALWIAALVANIGTWAHEVGAGWQMTLLTKGMDAGHVTLLVALVQCATTVPSFVLTMPAGVLADLLNRRRMMLLWNSVSFACAVILAIVSFGGWMQPWILLLASLGLGVGAAMVNPPWQTAMVDLVPRNELEQASALNSVSLNLSRATGPAIGGMLLAAFGTGAVFSARAASFIGILFVLVSWRYQRPAQLNSELSFTEALKDGLKYIRGSHAVHAVVVRTVSYVLGASALWALMPLVARDELGLNARGYGWLLASLGVGAVTGAAILPRVRRGVGPNAIMFWATLLYACEMGMVSRFPRLELAFIAMFCAGLAWVTLVTIVNVSAQLAGPTYVRGRVFACYLTVHFGAMAAGSAAWGFVAGRIGISGALACAAAAMVLGLLTMTKWRLQRNEVA